MYFYWLRLFLVLRLVLKLLVTSFYAKNIIIIIMNDIVSLPTYVTLNKIFFYKIIVLLTLDRIWTMDALCHVLKT